MEIISETPFLFYPEPSQIATLGPRPAGLHCTQLLGEIEDRLGYGVKDPLPEPDLKLYREGGFIFEPLAEAEFKRRRIAALGYPDLFTQLAMVHNFIHYTPDGLAVILWRLLEFKFLWKSSNRMNEGRRERDMWKILHQVRAYLGVIGEVFHKPIYDAHLIIAWVVGRYPTKLEKGFQHPIVIDYYIRFTAEEIRQTLEMLWVQAATHPEWIDLLEKRKAGIIA